MSGNNLLPNQFIKVSILQFYCSFTSFCYDVSQTSTNTGLAYMSNGSVSKWKQATAIGNFIKITYFDAHKLSGLNKRKKHTDADLL